MDFPRTESLWWIHCMNHAMISDRIRFGWIGICAMSPRGISMGAWHAGARRMCFLASVGVCIGLCYLAWARSGSSAQPCAQHHAPGPRVMDDPEQRIYGSMGKHAYFQNYLHSCRFTMAS